MNNFFIVRPSAVSMVYDDTNGESLETYSNLTIDLDEWPLDGFFTEVGRYFVDEIIYSELSHYEVTGIKFKRIKNVICSGNFMKYPSDVILPSYRQLIVNGDAFKDDFGIYISKNGRGFLVMSEKALKILLKRNCQNIMGEKIPPDIEKDIYFESVLTKIKSDPMFYPYFHESMFFKNK
ncbi:MAG: hypothetical protein IPM42_20305 [Saprospiraceae bacterium]|nr:hypothetical protein [Saprospiraceae bacterium]